jgi:hypothetical protein
VPANQVFAQAYGQAGGTAPVQSYTMPGMASSRSFNPLTGQYSAQQVSPSWDGNMAYNAMDDRPGPIVAQATGVDGRAAPWQDTFRQREAFVGNLSERLNQYSGGQAAGPKTYDFPQIMQQAEGQLERGEFVNPFNPASQDVQRTMSAANPYMTGTQWQNPFGNSPQANNPRPTWNQQSYDPAATAAPPSPSPSAPARTNARNTSSQYGPDGPRMAVETDEMIPPHLRPSAPGQARPVTSVSVGTAYNPRAAADGLPDVPKEPARAPERRYEGRTQTASTPPDRPANNPQLTRIDGELNKWRAATYGTRQGGGPPAEWLSHIRALERLRARAQAGDPAAMAWRPKMQAPPPHQQGVGVSRDRGGFNNRKFTGVAGNARPTGYSWN